MIEITHRNKINLPRNCLYAKVNNDRLTLHEEVWNLQYFWPAPRSGQKRIYSPKDLVALQLILRGKRISLPLADNPSNSSRCLAALEATNA